MVFNIYDKLVNAITLNVKKLWQNKKFVIPILLGLVVGILLVSKLVTKLYNTFPLQTSYFFIGLIIGSVPLIFKLMVKKSSTEKFSTSKIIVLIICALVGFAILVYMGYLNNTVQKPEVSSILPDFSFLLVIKMFVAGIFGAMAMIIPGVSGSLLFLILGVYTTIMQAISSLTTSGMFVKAALILAPCALGILVGLVGGAKLISILLKKIPSQTYAVIFGLVLGSVITVFPGTSFGSLQTTIVSVICLLIGAALSFFSTKFAPKEK